MSLPLYPNIHVSLSGKNGNVFSIIGRVRSAMREARLDQSEIDAFTKEASAGNYDHALQTVMKWVSTS